MKTLLLFISMLLLHLHGVAQLPVALKKVEGLRTQIVYTIMQDSKGFIWLGTAAGAVCYDGYRFRYYTTEEGLTNNDVFQIKEDSKGRLWLLNNSGKPALYDHGRILHAGNTPWLQHIQPQKLSIYFSQEPDNSIWYVTLDTAYHLQADRVIEKLTIPPHLNNKDNIQRVIRYGQSLLLVGNTCVYNASTGQYRPFNSMQYIGGQHTRTYVYNNRLYYFEANRLSVFNLNTKENTIVHTFTPQDAGLCFIPGNHPDTVWLSTAKDIYTLALATGAVTPVSNQLPHYTTGIFKDAEGNTWLTSLSDGLLLQPYSNPYKAQRMQLTGLPDSLACNAFSIAGNTLYAGFTNGSFAMRKQGKWQTGKLGTTAYKVCLQFTHAGPQLWCAATTALMLLKDGKQYHLPVSAKAILPTRDGLYIASSDGLLLLPQQQLEHLSFTRHMPLQSISGQRCTRLALKGKDTLLTVGIMGMQAIVNQKVMALPWHSPLLQAHITQVAVSGNGHILFTTANKGIGIIAGDSVYNITKQNGLSSNRCNNLSIERDGSLWLATDEGVNFISYNITTSGELYTKVYNLNKKTGLPVTVVYDVLNQQDTLLMATEAGLYQYSLHQASHATYKPPVYIESLRIHDSLVLPSALLQVDHHKSRFQFNFIGIAYQATGKIEYRYRLLPADNTWHYTTNTFAEYPYLPPGKYVFEVAASINGEDWSVAPAVMQLNILLPFWKTAWFIVLVSLLLLLAIWASIHYSILSVKRKHALQQQLKDLEYKALRLQMNPHFIFNAINAIKGFYASGNTADAKYYIDTFSSLMRLMLETGNDTHISLRDELTMLDTYLKLSVLRYNKRFTYSIRVNLQQPAEQLYLPIMLIQPFVENAVVHGVASLKEGGEIEVYFEQQNNVLHCTIEDNGIGRNKAMAISSRRLHTSKGIAITQQRLYGLDTGNQLLITDKQHANGMAAGTRVQLTIHMGKQPYDTLL